MKEANFNHDIVERFKKIGGFGYKIPDPDRRSILSGGKRPFDGFVCSKETGSLYFESKLMKDKLSAFSKDRIENHQYDSLLQLKNFGENTSVLLAFWVPRKDYYFFSFDVDFIFNLQKKSILAKELAYYRDAGFAISMKEPFEPNSIMSKQIKALPEGDSL